MSPLADRLERFAYNPTVLESTPEMYSRVMKRLICHVLCSGGSSRIIKGRERWDYEITQCVLVPHVLPKKNALALLHTPPGCMCE